VAEFVKLYPDPSDVLSTGITVWPDPDGLDAQSDATAALRRFATVVAGALPSFVQRSTDRGSGPHATVSDDGIAGGAMGVGRDASGAMFVDGGSTPQPAAPSLAAGTAERLHDVERDVPRAITLTDTARLCARLAQVRELDDIQAVLADAVRCLDAVGMVVWLWDPPSKALQPLLTYGYSASVLARISMVPGDAENAVAAAFRCGDIRVVSSAADLTGALVVPIVTGDGPVGAVAVEVRSGEQHESVRAFSAIFAAQLGMMLGLARFVHSKSA
jgi:hypothetical protein